MVLAYPNTVDARNPANQLRLVGYPIIYKVLYIPGGAGFLPSTVSQLIETNICKVSQNRFLYYFSKNTIEPQLKLTNIEFWKVKNHLKFWGYTTKL